MSANSPYKVKVLRLIEDEVIVYAVTSDEAKEEASKLPNVAKVLEAEWIEP